MKSITSIPEYKQLSQLPSKIKSLEHSLKKNRAALTGAIESKETVSRKLEDAYITGSADEVKAYKAAIKKLASKIETLKAAIDTGNEDLNVSQVQLKTAKTNFKNKVIPIVNDKLKAFQKSLAETEKLNDELVEISNLCSFTAGIHRMGTIPPVPILNFKKGTGSYTPTKNLNGRIEKWNGQTA